MAKRYENPVLYNSVNQPVDKKTGLIIQQEIPVCQLGRMTQKYDQGFLDFVADRAVNKFFAKKGTRGTAIFLPDRIRFTRKGFRNVLFYREIRVFYKSDPQTFCFVLYVISEKDQKRRYEVYKCDNMEDARRIEDILEASKHSANRLLLDPAPTYNGNYRSSSPTSHHSIKPKEPVTDATSNLVFECPHCQRYSRVAPEAAPSVTGTVIDSEHIPVKSATPEVTMVRSKSLARIDEDTPGSIRIEDRWRDTDYYGYFDEKKAKTGRPQGLSNKWSVWGDDDYEIVERRIRRRPPNSHYGHGIHNKPYHVTSTYGSPVSVNHHDPNRQRALYDGKPRLNRQTMQVVEPYVELPQARMRRYRSESDLANVLYEEAEEKPKMTKTKDDTSRPEEIQKPGVYTEPVKAKRDNSEQTNNHRSSAHLFSGQHLPITPAKSPIQRVIELRPTETLYIEGKTQLPVKQSNPNNQERGKMCAERIAESPNVEEAQFIYANPAPFSAASRPQSKPEITYMKTSVPIEYSLESDTVTRRYMSPTKD